MCGTFFGYTLSCSTDRVRCLPFSSIKITITLLHCLIGEKLRLGKKSDLLTVLPVKAEKSVAFNVKVLDSAAIVHLLSINSVSTFDNYASDVFIPYIKK